MKNYFFIVVFVLFQNGNLFSQTIPFQILKSAVFQDDYKNSVFVLADKNSSNEMVFVRYYESGGITPGEGLYIEKYSSDLKPIKEIEFSTQHPNHEKYNMIVGVFPSDDKINIVEVFYDLNDKAIICRANTIDSDFKTSKKELFRIKKEEVAELGSFSLQQIYYERNKDMWTNTNSGDIKSETDLSKPESTFPRIGSNIIMVVNEAKNAFAIALDIKQSKSKVLKLFVFDNNLEKKIDTHFTREAKDDEYIFENIQVAEDGNSLYVLGKSYEDDLRKKKIGGKYIFELTKVSAASQQTLIINPQEHFIGYLKPFLHNNEIVLLGFFSDFDDQNFTGICHYKTDVDLTSLAKPKFNLFTKQFVLDKYGEKKENKALKNLVFRTVFFTKANDIIVSAEEEEITASSSGVGIGVGTKTKLTYEYDDIICAKMNRDGELIWARNINKDQKRSDEDNFYISYTSMIKNDSPFFFINANEEVKKLNDGRIEFGSVSKDKSNLNVLRIDAAGNFEFQKILTAEENSIPFMVSKGIIIENDIYFLGRKGKNKQLLKVTLL